VVNKEGRVGEGLYAAGWVKRGSSGVISTNRRDATAVADHIAADFDGGVKPGREAMEQLFAERGLSPVTFSQWQKIDQAQIAAANPGAPRRKFVSVADMLAVL
jgi:ferredoxin--NADP+ reductase